MRGSLHTNHLDLFTTKTELKKHWGWFLTWGILLVILGAIAISVSAFTTMLSVLFLGVLLTIGGIIVVIDSFKFWSKQWGGFFLTLLMGILYLIAGIILIRNPIYGAISLTFILAIFYVVLGIFRVITFAYYRLPHWGWGLFSGIVATLLGMFILIHWPMSGLFIIGLFVGIDLIFLGWSYIILSLSARKIAN